MKNLFRSFLNILLPYGMIAGILIILSHAVSFAFYSSTLNIIFGILILLYNIIVLLICQYMGVISYFHYSGKNELKYRRGFLLCISIGFVAILVVFAFDLVYYYIIDPHFLRDIIEQQKVDIINNIAIQQSQKQMLLSTLSSYESPIYYVSKTTAVSFVLSVIISAFTAVFTVRKLPSDNVNR